MRGTVVHEAAFLGHADVLRILFAMQGPDSAPAIPLDAQGPYDGLTALHDAIWHGHREAAEALVNAGASLVARIHAGLTPRDLAPLYGHSDLAQMLADPQTARAASPE